METLQKFSKFRNQRISQHMSRKTYSTIEKCNPSAQIFKESFNIKERLSKPIKQRLFNELPKMLKKCKNQKKVLKAQNNRTAKMNVNLKQQIKSIRPRNKIDSCSSKKVQFGIDIFKNYINRMNRSQIKQGNLKQSETFKLKIRQKRNSQNSRQYTRSVLNEISKSVRKQTSEKIIFDEQPQNTRSVLNEISKSVRKQASKKTIFDEQPQYTRSVLNEISKSVRKQASKKTIFNEQPRKIKTESSLKTSSTKSYAINLQQQFFLKRMKQAFQNTHFLKQFQTDDNEHQI